MRFNDQIVLITGGGSGIGREMAIRFAAEGASLVIADRYLDAAQGTVDLIEGADGSALATQTDVSQADQVEAMAKAALDRFGKVDVLVNNAGLSVGDTILDFDEAAWDLNVDVVLKAVYLCSRALLPQMIERGKGVILNIGSVNGLMAIGESAYSAAKAGMISLTGNMAIHYGDKGVRVNCIAPGTIQTPDLERAPEAGAARDGPHPALVPARPGRPARGCRQGRPLPLLRRRLVDHRGYPSRRRRPDRRLVPVQQGVAGHPRMTFPTTADAVVIGAGAFGFATAYHLAKAGVRDVVLLDQYEPGTQVSARAAGLFKLIQASEVKTRLAQRATQVVTEFEAETGVALPFITSGSIYAARTPAHASMVEAEIEDSRGWGVRLERLSPKEVTLSVAVAARRQHPLRLVRCR